MTKQLTTATTTSATTISSSNLTPTAISPTINTASPTATTTATTAAATSSASTTTTTTTAAAASATLADVEVSTTWSTAGCSATSMHQKGGNIIADETQISTALPNFNQTTLLNHNNNNNNVQNQKKQQHHQQQQQHHSHHVKSKGHSDASGRSAALERAYVHDVYEHCEEPTGPIRPRVAQFLSNLDPGSVVCDVGCGSGRYLTQCNPAICTVGVDRCHRLSRVAREKGGEVALCDNLELPFRDDSFDAVLSLAVVHHFATTERRVSALRELARILRIGGRVIITVWALEQRHRRFESQDVLIPWQPPKNRNFNYSDEDDEADDFLPPYHAYTEDSTNSSRSAGDGDSSSLSSSSPGESCYSFVRRAIQKLAGGRKHPWFLDSWTSKETKNDSSLDYEDAKDLPIELRRLEDFEDFNEPPLSAGLKSRSLGSILNPPPRQIVRSRSSVPSLGAPLLLHSGDAAAIGGIAFMPNCQNAQFLSALEAGNNNGSGGKCHLNNNNNGGIAAMNGHSPTGLNGSAGVGGVSVTIATSGSGGASITSLGRRPKLIKQKQSLCDEDNLQQQQLPDNPYHMITSYNSSSQSFNSSLYLKSGCYHHYTTAAGSGGGNGGSHRHPATARQMAQASSVFLRKQSSLNEELMAGNRIREKERVRKRIQKQMSLNEAFLCRSALFSKRLQVIREGFTSKIKSSTGSLERVTKHSLTKIMQNFKAAPATEQGSNADSAGAGSGSGGSTTAPQNKHCAQHPHHHHHHHHHMQQQQQQQNISVGSGGSSSGGGSSYRLHFQHLLHRQTSLSGGGSGSTTSAVNKFDGPVIYCNSAECASTSATVCYCSSYHHGCTCGGGSSTANADENAEEKARRHSRESGSDSSKDSSLQSDTSIESEDSFASVIFIPKPEQHQQQLNYQQQHQNSSSSNSSSSNGSGGNQSKNCAICAQQQLQQPQQLHCIMNCTHMGCASAQQQQQQQHHQHHHRHVPSVPTSPLIMPCPPTPAHSPAAAQTAVTSPPQTMAAVTAAMAILTPPCHGGAAPAAQKTEVAPVAATQKAATTTPATAPTTSNKNHFTFDEAHIAQQKQHDCQASGPEATVAGPAKTTASAAPSVGRPNKITRQIINELPPIPKFRKQQSLQLQRQSFPIVRRSSATSGVLPSSSIPKLLSLELFNPATDDLDSDSSEPSSPDSIDSVISAPKSACIPVDATASSNDDSGKVSDEQTTSTSADKDGSANDGSDVANLADFEHMVRVKQQAYHSGDLKISATDGASDIIVNIDDEICQTLSMHAHETPLHQQPAQDCNIFAEQLSAQLRVVEDQNNGTVECHSLESLGAGDLAELLDDPLSSISSGGGGSGGGGGSHRKRNGSGGEQQRDLTALREELRERRLMLANLSTQPSLQQSPTSSSTSSLSSQTRSFTIHEEDEDEDEEENERSYTLQLYENCKISKFNYKRNRHYNLNPETAYLLQDDGDSSVREDEEDELDDVILEEDEEGVAEDMHSVAPLAAAAATEQQQQHQQSVKCSHGNGNVIATTKNTATTNVTAKVGPSVDAAAAAGNTTQRQSTESWEHSNSSTTSLDSPSQGGATTHHRYYHVFREGELDALINHHVSNLHIVSSYYERASWCVVAEKVQVWTI